MDFGLARLGRRDTGSRGFSGTLGYAAPEVMRGAEGGAVSDVFAFGVMLQELLTGQRPWSGSDPGELVHRIMNEPPVPIPTGSLASADAPALIALVTRCLSIEPTSRYADGRALCSALDEVGRT
jgi:serine/threonine-protein kinase